MERSGETFTRPTNPSMRFAHVEGFIFSGNQNPTSEIHDCSEHSIHVVLNVRNTIKKELVESLDNNILHIESLRARIERLEETCNDIVDDMCNSNRARKTNIHESYVTRLDQM
jgi:hypothetical protein